MIGSWAIGLLTVVLGILGLFVASGAQDGTMGWVGVVLAIFAGLFNYALIMRHTGQH